MAAIPLHTAGQTAEITFAALEDVLPRLAWQNEAVNFTPWLADNLDRLADAIGIPLEHQQSEVQVGTFWADILARNPRDDSLVLIENQLEEGDHRHLGQIMTYLAGLQPQVIVWVSPRFREEHLSAIRWLNEHTVDPFAFFAVRLRVVRIGTSPFAPLFEVVEKPNGWDRRVQEVARESRDMSEIGQRRKAFWALLSERHPDIGPTGSHAASSWWLPVVGTDVYVTVYFAQESVGIFVRGDRGVEPSLTVEKLAVVEEQLKARLGAEFGRERDGGRYLFNKYIRTDTREQANWADAADWMKREVDLYRDVLGELLRGAAG